MPRTGKYGRMRQLWEIVAHDKLALTELTSGLFLVALRGALLLGAPPLVYVNYEVADVLQKIHVTENAWGLFLTGCGILQVLLVEHRRTWLRVAVTFAILLAIVVMVASFYTSGGAWAVPLSLYCMAAFYTFLLGRVIADWKDQCERKAVLNGG